jgi:DNA-binding PadR family transcriptional regulator
MPAKQPEQSGSPPTPTGYALLGLLSFGQELSGYELKQWADISLRFFWSAPAMSQVYRELERLAAGGFVCRRAVVRDGTRATKVYRLTPQGEQAVRAWLAEVPEPPSLKHPVALRLFFGHLLEPEDLRKAIEAHRDWCDQMMVALAEIRDGLGDDPMWRNAARVAEWGLDYYRGEQAAVEHIGRAALEEPPEVVPSSASEGETTAS